MNSFFLTDNFSGDIMVDYPFLGAQYHKDKTVFRVQSEHAAGMELCLFSPDEKEEIRIKMNKGDDNVWTAEVPAVKPGQKYGYRAYGEYDPSRGLFFNPAKLAVDPYGFEVSKTMDEWTSPLLDIENSHDSAPVMPKSVVVDMKRIFDPEKYPHLQKRPSFPIAKDIIYETHIKNFSHLNTMLPREKRGKLSGLGDSWTLNYFKRLGVNNIELMPIAPTCCGRQIQKREGRTDSWGYNPYCFFAVDPRYGNWEDFAAAVSELHKAGIKVTVDAVFNHTGEHAATGERNQSLSFKLLLARRNNSSSLYDLA
jgi:isoamylase